MIKVSQNRTICFVLADFFYFNNFNQSTESLAKAVQTDQDMRYFSGRR